MPVRVRLFSLASLFFLAGCLGTLPAQRVANANAIYQQLRGLLPGGEVITVKDFELKRDAATFTFHNGSFAFYSQVNGKVTGAIFIGQGHLKIEPPNEAEGHNLSIQMHTEVVDEDFDRAVLRFTDSTADDLRKASTGPGHADAGFVRDAEELQTFLRHHAEGSNVGQGGTFYFKTFYGNLDLRLLEDVLSPVPGGYFMAAMHATKDRHLYFIIDPNGIDEVEPEEVALLTWDSTNETETIPLAFHRAEEYAAGTASNNEHNSPSKILDENLDVGIEHSGMLSSVATVHVRAEKDGLAVVPLDLYPTLRVSQVTGENDAPLDWVQEKKDVDPDLGVVLATPLKKGESATLKVAYGGKDVVLNEGNNNYYPVAREDWFPNSNQGFGDYATYHMVFHIPKDLQIIATGTKIGETADGKLTVSEWKTETPLPVVGFSIGDFKMKEAQFNIPPDGELTVDAYANTMPPSQIEALAQQSRDNDQSLGTLDTTPMLANELSQGEVAAQVYTNFFGPLPFHHISLTQQSACDYGQSWPMLVYLPICGFFDSTQRHFLGLSDFGASTYWDVVTPHEVAHQWWGHTVGFRGYRDQWMSEGFADASAAIFLQITRPKPDDFLHFWQQQRRLLTEKNQFGFRPIDVGPVTMGVRLSSPKSGWDVYENLVYPKGAFILHMIRMMMWTPKEGDARFKATMHDFVSTYTLQAATTEDFKAIVEKHMSPGMDLEGNQKFDWFFREYVYGTDLPDYHFQGTAIPNPGGWAVHFTLAESGVPESFRMMVPIYLNLVDGHTIRLGEVAIHGEHTIDQTIQLPQLSAAIKSVSINNNYDVLCAEN
jgi:peptidase M1-like protein